MNPTDDKLNDLFTVHIAGFPTTLLAGDTERKYLPSHDGQWLPLPDFCNDPGAVLQWMSSLGCWTATFHGDLYSIGLKKGDRVTAFGVYARFARAAMIACLKSKDIYL